MKFAASLAIALSFGSTVGRAQSIQLRMEPEAGLSLTYHVESSFWIVSPMMPNANPDAPFFRLDGFVTQTVTRTDDQSATFRTIVDSSDIQLPAGLGVPEPDVAGVTVVVTMDSRGRVLESRVEPGTLSPALRGFKGQIEQMLSGISISFPEEPIAVGESWSSSNRGSMQGPTGAMLTDNTSNYTLRRVELRNGNRVAIIGLEGIVSQESDSGSGPPAMMRFELNGTVTGEFEVDLDLGRIIRLESSTDLDGEVKLGNSANGAPIQVTSRTTMEIRSR